MKIHTSKSFLQDKIDRYHLQGGLCKLCKRPLNPDITSNHLDHDHSLDGPNAGKVRGLLCNLCNSLEGQVKHKFERSGLKSKDIDMGEWVQNLITYWQADTSDAMIHPRYAVDMVKRFSRMNKSDMTDEMSRIGCVVDDSLDKAMMISVYKKQLKKVLK